MNTSRSDKDSQILQQRAQELAKPLVDQSTPENLSEVLVFSLSQERYAIETQYIKEVFPLGEYTQLPGTPTFLLGLVNLRRKIIAVIDLRILFDLEAIIKERQKLILLGNTEKEFAITTDGIHGIQHISLREIDAPPPTLSGIRQEFLKGITTERIAVLDGHQLLASSHLIVNETVEATT